MREETKVPLLFLKRYQTPLLVILLGMALLLFVPKSGAEEPAAEGKGQEFDRLLLQEEMERMLSRIEGTGKLSLMLMVDADSERELARDVNISLQDGKEQHETVVIGAGSGREETVVTRSHYPDFTGALVVCEGADSAAVRYDVVAAVSVLTGLSSNQISVVKGTA